MLRRELMQGESKGGLERMRVGREIKKGYK